MQPVARKLFPTILLAASAAALSPHPIHAQGCTPIRFITPTYLGSEGQAYQAGHRWRGTLAYRRLSSNQWFIGTTQAPDRAPGGVVPVFSIHTVVAELAYSISDRVQVRVSVPYSTGKLTRVWPDQVSHEQTASGVGDIGVMGEAWLLNPEAHEHGNVLVGLGIKAPTGSHTKSSQYYAATGPVVFPADQTIQPSDGGWAVVLQAQAFQRVSGGLSAYGYGSYMANPREQTEVLFNPTSTVYWSVPDVYSARLGAAYSVWPDQGLSVSLGGRMDGIPTRDLFGGGDNTTIKRTSNIIYADPGLSLTRGNSTFTLNVPIRVRANRTKSLLEARSTGAAAVNGGGYAKYLVFASYSHRFP